MAKKDQPAELDTVEAVDAKMDELRGQKEDIVSQLRDLAKKRDALVARDSAMQKVAAMSPAERAALGLPEPQVLQTEGIESSENVTVQ